MDYLKVPKELEKVASQFLKEKSERIDQLVQSTCASIQSGHKILVYGNGGSAAQAQHFAAELVNRFLINRMALPAIALNTDTSALTSIANDSSYDYVFSRQIEAIGSKGDISLAISTSGNSPSVINAVEVSRTLGLVTVGLTGEGGGRLEGILDVLLDVPSSFTPRIQEVHLIFLHLFAQEIEQQLSAPSQS